MRASFWGGFLLFLLLIGFASLMLVKSSAQGAPIRANWTRINADPNGTNHVEQGQIGPTNVDQVVQRWLFAIPPSTPVEGLNVTGRGSISPPLIVNGTVYIVTNYLRVYAFEASDGSVIWSYQASLNRTGLPLSYLTGHVHGINYYRNEVWVSLPDCSVLGLDAGSGRLVHHVTKICSAIPGNAGLYDSSGVPPIFYHDLLVWSSSISEGTDVGRGFVAAYNLTTGSLLWRWFVTPAAGGDPSWDLVSCPPTSCHGNITPYPGDWGTMGSLGGASLVGAGPSFGEPVVDQKTGILYVSTSQPSPDWNATHRPGPDLYSDSIVALNATSGKLIWFYQSTPHDLWDFDCGWNVVLGSVTLNGSARSVVFKGCKNGYVYALDASSGSLLWYFDPPSVKRLGTGNADYVRTGTYDAKQLWIDYPSVGRFEQCPGANGAIESDLAFAYGSLYVATFNFCAFGFVAPVDIAGANEWGIRQLVPDFSEANTTIYGLNASSGRVVWSYALPRLAYRGWLTASNGIVYAGALDGYIHALDGRTGRQISTVNVGQSLYESPTIGSTLGGDTILLQLTSPPSYGGFSGNETSYLIAFGLAPPNGLLFDYALYGVIGVVISAGAFILLRRLRGPRGNRRAAGPR